MKKDIKEKIIQVKEELDNISVSSEVIEHLNELVSDKLEEIQRYSTSDKAKLLNKDNVVKLYELLRNNNNYVTLTYLIMQELEKINATTQKAYTLLNQLDDTNTDDTKH